MDADRSEHEHLPARDAAGEYIEEWARTIILRPEGTTGGPVHSGRTGDTKSENQQQYYRPPMNPPEGYDGPDAINALCTQYDPQGDVTHGWLSTLVWNTRNVYLGLPGATFSADQMRMVCEGFLAEIATLRAMPADRSEWEVAECDSEALPARLGEGWEPYAVLWVRKDKFTSKMRHFLKRRTAYFGSIAPSQEEGT